MRRLYIFGAIVLLLTTGCIGGSQTETTDQTTHTGANIELGKTVFETHCRVCHGADGTGNPAIGAADLTSERVKSLSRERKIDQVTNGGAQMPSFSKALTAEEIEAVVDYIATLE